MALYDHIRTCNKFDPTDVLPLMARGDRIGLVRRDNAAALRPYGDVFAVAEDHVRLIAEGDQGELTELVDTVVESLVAEQRVPKWRNETFDVSTHWGAPVLFRLDRGAVPFFGVRAYGVHLNGYRQGPEGLSLWVGRRAADKKVAPDKLDNLVAGGIGNGHGLEATLFKEADEEAGIPRAVIERAVPVGALSYRMETRQGIRDDVLFVYDIETPDDLVPKNKDGEIVSFELMPAKAVLERIRHTEDFKFNVNLVVLDFMVRHGILHPDDPEYLPIVTELRRPLD